mmetsp:Transcript_9822/g.18970  ORF Transcript_9822/g.18970 Transcript_9822/m.18970 type:complete len:228 (+) Transcript_9822:1855-2538(+)
MDQRPEVRMKSPTEVKLTMARNPQPVPRNRTASMVCLQHTAPTCHTTTLLCLRCHQVYLLVVVAACGLLWASLLPNVTARLDLRVALELAPMEGHRQDIRMNIHPTTECRFRIHRTPVCTHLGRTVHTVVWLGIRRMVTTRRPHDTCQCTTPKIHQVVHLPQGRKIPRRPRRLRVTALRTREGHLCWSQKTLAATRKRESLHRKKRTDLRNLKPPAIVKSPLLVFRL